MFGLHPDRVEINFTPRKPTLEEKIAAMKSEIESAQALRTFLIEQMNLYIDVDDIPAILPYDIKNLGRLAQHRGRALGGLMRALARQNG